MKKILFMMGLLLSLGLFSACSSNEEEMDNDPLRKFLEDARISAYNDRNGHQDKRNRATELENEYKRALYWMRLNKGVLQYPDANSTMRISYGRVGGFEPNDGVEVSFDEMNLRIKVEKTK